MLREWLGMKKVILTFAVVSIGAIVLIAAMIPQPLAALTTRNNSSSKFLYWNTTTISNNGTDSSLLANVTSYFYGSDKTNTNSTLTFSAVLDTGSNKDANGNIFWEVYTNITGNISMAFSPDYIVFSLNDYGNNTNVQWAEPQPTYWDSPPSENVSLITWDSIPPNNPPTGYYTNFSLSGNNGSLSLAGKLLNETSSGNGYYHFCFAGYTLIQIASSNSPTSYIFHLYATLKGLAEPVGCELTLVVYNFE